MNPKFKSISVGAPTGAFRPDLLCYRDAGIAGAAGAFALGVGSRFGYGGFFIGAALAASAGAVAWKWFQEGKRRGRGFVVEDATLKSLKVECDARGWVLKTDMWFDGVGNLDAVIVMSSMTCILEIKSHGGLRVHGNRVVRCNRTATPADKELNQAQRQALKVRGSMKVAAVMPVLWCPMAPREAGVVHDGVLLANGSVELMAEILAEMDSQGEKAGIGGMK